MPESIQTAEDKNRIVGLKFLPGSITWDTYDPEQHRHGGAHRLTKNAKWNKEKREAAERKQKAKEEANPTPAFTLAPTPTPVPQGIYLKTSETCENFITLCEGGYYNGVKFHRSIKNFMLQASPNNVAPLL
eukprot:gene1305-1892_t